LVDVPVAAMVANSTGARAAKRVTRTTPIVFVSGADPVAEGLVPSINRPGGNITGVSFFDVPVTGKRLTLLRELVPQADSIALLQDPNFQEIAAENQEIETTVKALGFRTIALKATNDREINAAFSTVARSGAG